MNENKVTGRVHSIQSLGTVDGPGVRFVVFMQGCNLRCGCCHNPDTWSTFGGKEYTAAEIAERAERYREYFGSEGGVTVSGGEPLLQADFVRELFAECHARGINTCLDTSGSILGERTDALLDVCDRVLLDIKYTSDSLYREHVGCSLSTVLAFFDRLQAKGVPTTVRQVTIPTLNDRAEDVLSLRAIVERYPCVDKVELLPFKKICAVKYKEMDLPFKFAHLPTPDRESMMRLNDLLFLSRKKK